MRGRDPVRRPHVLVGLALAALAGCPSEAPSPPRTEPARPASGAVSVALHGWATKVFEPLPAEAASKKLPPITAEKVALGRLLYFDARLSSGRQLACATCHDPAKVGADGQKVSAGLARNAPTTFDAALQVAQFWDAREPDVESATREHLLDPKVMAMQDGAAVAAALKAIPGYAEPFQRAFPGEADPISLENAALAIGAYLRRLLAPTRWDALLKGQADALNVLELEGLQVFKQVNCTMCHGGVGLGGHMQQKLGMLDGTFEDHPDQGKMFKVTPLRNVTRTGPWLHDGSHADLADLVKDMAKFQLGVDLRPDQTAALVAFMGALEGDPPADLTEKPELPR